MSLTKVLRKATGVAIKKKDTSILTKTLDTDGSGKTTVLSRFGNKFVTNTTTNVILTPNTEIRSLATLPGANARVPF